MMIHMISIGERTGELPDMLNNVAETYEEQVNSKIDAMTSLLEPAMIIGMGGMVAFVVLSVFIAGLMVGRTPEYLGKKIEAYDVKMSMLYVLIFPLVILTLTALFVMSPNVGLSALGNPGPHGLSEILYAFTSSAGNNGSAFAGLSANAWWYNTATGFTMLIGRFLMMIPVLALAGNLAQ